MLENKLLNNQQTKHLIIKFNNQKINLIICELKQKKENSKTEFCIRKGQNNVENFSAKLKII